MVQNNSNGWKKDPKFIFGVIVVCLTVVAGYVRLTGTVDNICVQANKEHKTIHNRIDKKVDNDKYQESVKRIDNNIDNINKDIDEVKKMQYRIEEKVDKILIK